MAERVFIGLSGGVDSSVAAKRLLERGYDVVGVFIKVWQPDFIHCNWEKERLDAMRVAAHLGIPFLTMHAEDVYKQEVADYMIRTYEKGLTPNPDVMCNEHVKFGAFYTWAKANGADKIATGHYAQTTVADSRAHLHKAVDASKDQSYFLWRVKQNVLGDVLFPIGDTEKTEIRKEAERARIPTALKADSQGICFLGHIDMYTFLSHYIKLSEGDVLDEHGDIIGQHKGALLYTKGQRHGFTVDTRGSFAGAHYVVSRNLERNTVSVSASSPKEHATEVLLTDLNILGIGFTETLHAMSRYHAKPEEVHITLTNDGNAILHTTGPSIGTWERGQSCVLYIGSECVGGGIIS